MNISDPIADLLTRIRNAATAGHTSVSIPHSKMKRQIADLLKKEGFIREIAIEGEKPKQQIKVYLKYTVDQEPAIRGLKRVSKPGLRQYTTASDMPRVLGGLGVAIMSTSKGILTGKQAREANLGGEVLCYVW
jgi:small subunit ribosomal protein S8